MNVPGFSCSARNAAAFRQPKDRRAEDSRIFGGKSLGRRPVIAPPWPNDPTIECDPRLPGTWDRAFRGQDRAAALAGARVAVLGGRPHHLRCQGAPLGAVSGIPPGDDRRVSAPRGGGAVLVDRTVKDEPFLIGEYCTIADIGCWGRMVFMAEGGFDIGDWPHLAAWAGRLKAMPGFALPYELIPSKDREFDPG